MDAAQLLAVRGRGGGHDDPGVGAPGERAGADGLAVFPEPAVADQRHFRGEAEAGSVPDHVVATCLGYGTRLVPNGQVLGPAALVGAVESAGRVCGRCAPTGLSATA